jgi:Zn-dependent peptidase ImmA (M78 family)
VNRIRYFRRPLALLEELGVTEPEDIRIEAIAEHCRATIVYERLEGAEARIIGFNDRAIITVNKKTPRERQRFSAAHELGHWMMDRGKLSFSCTSKVMAGEWAGDNPERRANQYAAELLLPEFMFRPLAKNKEITFATVKYLASEFQTSLTATAIRLVELGSYPAMVVCNEQSGRKWFFRGEDVPDVIWPREDPGRETIAYDLLRGNKVSESSADVYADGWITHSDSYKYSLHEDSIRLSTGMVLSLLWWKEEKQLLELETD